MAHRQNLSSVAAAAGGKEQRSGSLVSLVTGAPNRSESLVLPPLENSNLSVQLEKVFTPDYEGIFSTRLSPDGSVFAVGFGAGMVSVMETPKGTEIMSMRCTQDRSMPFLSLRFHPYHNPFVLYATGAMGIVYIGRITANTLQPTISEQPNEIMGMDVNCRGQLLGTVGKDMFLRIYDTNTKTMVNQYSSKEMQDKAVQGSTVTPHSLPIFGIKFHSREPDILITGGWDNTIQIWDRRFAKGLIRSIYGPHICGEGLDMKDNQILTASWQSREALQLWDFGSGRLLQTLPFRVSPHQAEQLYTAQFCRAQLLSNLVFAGGSGTNSVQSIDILAKEVVGEIRFEKAMTALSTVDDILVCGSMDNTLKISKILPFRL